MQSAKFELQKLYRTNDPVFFTSTIYGIKREIGRRFSIYGVPITMYGTNHKWLWYWLILGIL
jgi:hypothetical protein